MKKLICSLLTLSIVAGSTAFAADISESHIAYLKSDEEYAYGMTYVITDKATGEVIPISIGPLDGYSYAYMPDGGEFEVKAIKPETFADYREYQDGCVSDMQVRGVMVGYPDGTFGKYNKLTRAEMAAVFCRMFSIEPSNNDSCFSDVVNEHWCCGNIMALVEHGVFKRDTIFRPDDQITREEFTAMLARMINDMGYIENADENHLSIYEDIDQLSEYARKPYNDLIANDYIILFDMEDNDFMDIADDEFFLNPKETVTRYDCADILSSFIRSFLDNNAPAIRWQDAPDVEIPILDGSTSTYKITENIYRGYYCNSENHPDLPKAHSKTTNSYKKLIDGEVEMIFVPDSGDEVKQYAKEKNVELEYIPIADEALIFFTGLSNPSTGLTTDQLKQIYVDNSVENWSEVGGADAPLAAFCRNEDSGSHTQIDKFVLEGKEIHPDIKRVRTSIMMASIFGDLDDYERANHGAYGIGYSLYYYLFLQAEFRPDDFKLLSVDGITPSAETIADKSYPYITQYYAVIRRNANENTKKFAELMKGEFGKGVVSASGYGTFTAE